MSYNWKLLLNKLIEQADYNTVAICGNSLCYEIDGVTNYNDDLLWGKVIDNIVNNSEYQTEVDNMHLFIKRK